MIVGPANKADGAFRRAGSLIHAPAAHPQRYYLAQGLAMLEPWSFASVPDINVMGRLVQAMRDTLSVIDDTPNPNANGELLAYCKSLVVGQRRSLGRTKAGSWAVAPNDKEMPADARVDFIFTPTYLGASILSRVLLDYPWIAIQIPGYRRSLKRGLDFCAYRNLQGSGYDAIDGMLDAFVILATGKVPILLELDPSLSPSLTTIIRELESYLRESLLRGQSVGSWGEDLTSGFQAALETLYLYQDKELLSSMRENQNVPTSSLAKELPW